MKNAALIFLLGLLLLGCNKVPDTQSYTENKANLSPDERYGELFERVQLTGLFEDSKTFADGQPKFVTDQILANFEKERHDKDFDLKAFVHENFILPQTNTSSFQSDTSKTATEHIESLWEVLSRPADTSTSGTLIPLPKAYLVPGGRFREVYYWDSYFTMLGLQTSGRWDLIENMVDNFAYLIETMGFIPNGNRTYYQGRSQPPFYSLMVKILEEGKGEGTLSKYLPYLQKEYDFWMDGASDLNESHKAYRRVVRLADSTFLNRYWDDIPKARPESFREDVELVKSMENAGAEEYRHIRAAAESGWDFSSRWFKDGQYMATIHTTEIIPVDLNALLYHLELTLSEAYLEAGAKEKSEEYAGLANNRKMTLLQYCWNEQEGFFNDYDFVAQSQTEIASLAAMYPLYFNMVEQYHADSVAKVIERDFLQAGGVACTIVNTSQQWDAPNGWAPLHWITIQGLRNYNHSALADTIKNRWIDLNLKVYKQTGKMVEKYNVYDPGIEGGGGEYPLQDGFGWTNGVLIRLLAE